MPTTLVEEKPITKRSVVKREVKAIHTEDPGEFTRKLHASIAKSQEENGYPVPLTDEEVDRICDAPRREPRPEHYEFIAELRKIITEYKAKNGHPETLTYEQITEICKEPNLETLRKRIKSLYEKR